MARVVGCSLGILRVSFLSSASFLSVCLLFLFGLATPQVSALIPTDGLPSPLFGAGEFEQQLILFEEFGTEEMPEDEVSGFESLPRPLDSVSGPAPDELEEFLAQEGMSPFPSRLSNVNETNPWKEEIEEYLGRELVAPANVSEREYGVAGPAEGRPGGQGWAHQRWDEFYPQVYFKTAQAGARANGGFRDQRQRHGYAVGEFGPGGLYNTVFTSSVPGAPTLNGTTNGLSIQIHPKMPIQGPDAVWTFDGTLPPKLLMARQGEAVLLRHYNALPINESTNRGFGKHTITTHEHNGHNPGESDGFAGAFYYPGQYWDYRWPLQLAGFDSINLNASDSRAAFPCESGETLPVDDSDDGVANPVLKACLNGSIKIRGDWRETMSTHWFHDHMLDHTAENVYKGNAAMMNYYSALDRGNEAYDDGVNLRFPSGTALSWGNRDYDVNLLVADKAWDQEGQLWFSHNAQDGHDGFIGDRVLTNWQYTPYLDVRARSYRFRILNGAVSRIFAIALVQQVQGAEGEIPGPNGSNVSYNRVPFHLIANDGNLMEHTVPFDGSLDLDQDGDLSDHKGQLPSQGIAERYDIIVDFSKHGITPGDRLFFVNVMEHDDGKGSKGKVPLEDVLSERYNPQVVNNAWVNGDPAVGKFLELRVRPYAGLDLSMNPADYESGKKKMIVLPIDRHDPALLNASRHTFEFVRSQGGSSTPWKIRVDGGDKNSMDPHRISALMKGAIEIWRIEGESSWTHPVHIHFEEGVILSRGGRAPPEWEKWARKDLYRVGPEEDSNETVEVAVRARDFVGTFVEHCHNTMHEDHAMLMRWDSQNPDVLELGQTPMPKWDGVEFESSFTEHDMVPPVITVLGDNPVSIKVGDAYTDAGATATDDVDDNLTASIQAASNVNPSVAGTYAVVYSVSDEAGNTAVSVRTVIVGQPTNSRQIDRVHVRPDIVNLTIGDVFQFTAEARDFNNEPVFGLLISWSMKGNDATVGNIDGNGLFTAVANGSASIIAVIGNVSSSADVLVGGAVTAGNVSQVDRVHVNPDLVNVSVGDVFQFTAEARDANNSRVYGLPVTWSMKDNDTTVGFVGSNGLFTAVANGSASVLAKIGNVSGSANVFVAKAVARDKVPPVILLSGNMVVEASDASGAVVSYTVSATDAIDGVVGASCLPASASVFALGTTVVICVAGDASGNQASASFNVTVRDSVAPLLSVISPLSGEFLQASNGLEIKGSVLDSGSGVTGLYTNDSRWNASLSGVSFRLYNASRLDDGPYFVRVYARDAFNNVNFSDVSFIIDRVIPSTLDDYGLKNGVWQNASQLIRLYPSCGASGCNWTRYCTTFGCDVSKGPDYYGPINVSANGSSVVRYGSMSNSGVLRPVSELLVMVSADASNHDGIYLKAGNRTDVRDGDLNLELNSTFNLTASLSVRRFSSFVNSSKAGLPSLGKFFEITSPSLRGRLGASLLKVNYSDGEVASAGLVESSLRLYFFNETSGGWEKFDVSYGGVDVLNNFVWALTDHFSTWGVFGDAVPAQDPAPSGGSGGSGGSGSGGSAASDGSSGGSVGGSSLASSGGARGGSGGGGPRDSFVIFGIPKVLSLNAGKTLKTDVVVSSFYTGYLRFVNVSFEGVPSEWYDVSEVPFVTPISNTSFTVKWNVPADVSGEFPVRLMLSGVGTRNAGLLRSSFDFVLDVSQIMPLPVVSVKPEELDSERPGLESGSSVSASPLAGGSSVASTTGLVTSASIEQGLLVGVLVLVAFIGSVHFLRRHEG